MNKALLIYALLATALLAAGVRLMKNYRDENRRLVQNQTALAAESDLIRSELDARSVETQALRLRVAEFEQLRAADAARIAEAGNPHAAARGRGQRARRDHPRDAAPRCATRSSSACATRSSCATPCGGSAGATRGSASRGR
ncbi:MAG: DUF6549 family protein [Alistipes sp.]